MLTIIPLASPLEMELLLPTRTIGFVSEGDNVVTRFDAFPYQKFGTVSGKIKSINKSVVLPTEKNFPIKVEEAVYLVRVTLSEQAIMAYGERLSLKVGMTTDADIIVESRTLMEWLLEPIYAVETIVSKLVNPLNLLQFLC